MKKHKKKKLTGKKVNVWHPESPGVRLTVYRNWFQRLFYPKHFATLGEAIKYGSK